MKIPWINLTYPSRHSKTSILASRQNRKPHSAREEAFLLIKVILYYSHTRFLLTVLHLGLLSTAGVEMESFSAPVGCTGTLWYGAGVSSLLPDLNTLKPLVEDAAQLSV